MYRESSPGSMKLRPDSPQSLSPSLRVHNIDFVRNFVGQKMTVLLLDDGLPRQAVGPGITKKKKLFTVRDIFAARKVISRQQILREG